MFIFLFIFSVITVLISLIIIASGLIMIRDSLFIKVPFVPTRSRAIPSIINALKLSQDSILYDIGCGDSRILISAISSVPGIRAIGIEKGIFPFIMSTIKTRGMSIRILRADYKDVSFSNATHIYCYLSTEEMNRIAPKITNECKSGTRVVSCDFEICNWEPLEIISIEKDNDQLAKKLFVYEK